MLSICLIDQDIGAIFGRSVVSLITYRCGFEPRNRGERPDLCNSKPHLPSGNPEFTRGSELARLVAEAIKPYRAHQITGGSIGNGMGLSIEEEPDISPNHEDTLEAGSVYTLRVGASDGRQEHGIVSAMVVVQTRGSEVLWRAV